MSSNDVMFILLVVMILWLILNTMVIDDNIASIKNEIHEVYLLLDYYLLKIKVEIEKEKENE